MSDRTANFLAMALAAVLGGLVATDAAAKTSDRSQPMDIDAGRQEGTSAPPLRTGVVPGRRTTFQTTEATFGYRVIPQVTVRASYMARKPFTRDSRDHQAGFSVVWAQRWW